MKHLIDRLSVMAVMLAGAFTVAKWEPYKDGIMRAKVPAGFATDQLFVNGESQPLARYPNFDPKARIFHGTAADAFSPDRAARWKNPVGGIIHVLHAAEWGSLHYLITGKGADNKVNIGDGCWGGHLIEFCDVFDNVKETNYIGQASIRDIEGLGDRSAYSLADESGMLVLDVPAASPAAKAGLLKDDVIVGCDGQPVRSAYDLSKLQNKAAGKPLALLVSRKQKQATIGIKDYTYVVTETAGSRQYHQQRNTP